MDCDPERIHKEMSKKEQIRLKYDEAKNVASNVERLAEAISLLVLGYTGIWYSLNHAPNKYIEAVLLFCGALIGTRGMIEFLKHMSRK